MNFLRGVGRPKLEKHEQTNPRRSPCRTVTNEKPTIYEQAKAKCMWQDGMPKKNQQKKKTVQEKGGFCYVQDACQIGPLSKGRCIHHHLSCWSLYPF
jgi:hypothetical protein